MDETTIVVIRFDGRFEIDAEGNWVYVNGRTKARLVHTKITYDELLEIAYEATDINPNHFRIKMKFIVRSCYKLDPIEIENDGDVKCFFKEHFRVDTMHTSPLFIEVETLQETPEVGERDNDCTIPFASRSGSNRPSCSRHAVDVNRSGIRDEEDEIPQNGTEANTAVDWSSVNLHDGADVVLPTIDEYDRLYNLCSHDVDYDDDTYQDMHADGDDDIELDNDIELENFRRVDDDELENIRRGDDDEVNATLFEVPFVTNADFSTASEGFRMGSVPIADDSRHHPRNENDSHPRRASTSRVSCPSTSATEPILSNDNSLSTTEEIEIGQIYTNKKELQQKLALYAMKENFEFKVSKSCSQRFEVRCTYHNCTWRVRATRVPNLDMWAIKVFINKHTCSQLEQCHTEHRQASSKYIGNHIKSKYQGIGRQYRPKDIQFDIGEELGIRITYDKAWRARESALNSIRGTPEESFKMLPLWCSMLETKNPGTITCIETTDDNCFLYFFMAFSQSMAGFKKLRPVVAVDGTHLKGKYKGMMFIASCFDGNQQIYPLAFGIADTENETSYTWFFQRFKEAYGEIDDLVFITDRHRGLETAIATVYPNAHHGNCTFHLSQNVKLHFGKNKHVHMAFYQAAKAYLPIDFEVHMRKLEAINIRAHQYVMEASPEKWARAFFPGNRYSIMTTNIAECMNAVLRDARSLPLVPLLEAIRLLLQDWFYERRTEAEAATTPVTPWLEKILRKRLNECRRFNVTPLSTFEFEVRTIDFVTTVNLEAKTCSCRQFQLDQYPCIHAIAACRFRNLSLFHFCSEYYSVSSWRECYAYTIYPLDDRRLWHAPPEVLERVVHPPMVRRAPGRPRTRRILSRGEERPHRKCSRCGVLGHNRQTCTGNVPL